MPATGGFDAGWRFPDLVIRDGSGNIGGFIESKLGSSRYTTVEQARDLWIRDTLGWATYVVRMPTL